MIKSGSPGTTQGDDGLGEFREAVKDLKAMVNAADDQASAMTDQELGKALIEGRWTTIEVHEAGRRLLTRKA